MREIKFRVWGNQLNKMVYQRNGWFERCFIGKNQSIQSCQLSLALEMNGDKLEVMQYTSLKDKNGKEVYEGDIIRSYNEFGEAFAVLSVVKWDEKQARYKGIDVDCLRLEEVVGNIHENPELLEAE